VLQWLDHGIIYLISNSKCVSPIQVILTMPVLPWLEMIRTS